jgi:hypothetical protein
LKILKKVESRKINPKEVEGKKFDEDESSKRQNATSS